jgi:N-acetylglucosaminyldiphosphoundecaprenol N-acetyl-beta-D-mannosaminyltransferase
MSEGEPMIGNKEAADYPVLTSTIETGEALIPYKASRLSIGHVGMDTYSEAALIAEVLDHALHGRVTRQIVTVNAQIYVLADKSARYRECLFTADYLCADGMPLVWACDRLGGLKVPRIAGVDLIEHLCRRGAADGLRVFLLGGKPETANMTAKNLSRRYPGLQIAGVSCPEWGFEKSKETLCPVLEQIARAKPHVLFAGLGAPKQELLIDEHIRSLKVPIAIGIGGSFEILSGSVERAPRWMQSSGLEWTFRLRQEPRRLWKRYLVGNAEFLWRLAKWRLQT